MSERRVKAIVEYDGGAYAGFQWQPSLPSVQATLEEALHDATGASARISASGRTDAGAHARGQVISFQLDTRLDDCTLLRAINAHLPADVALQALATSGPEFDPRRQATSREYRYLVLNRATPSPLWRGRAHHVITPLNVEGMQAAASHLVGIHDFSSFGNPPERENNEDGQRSAVRVMYSLDITRDQELITFRFVGNAFLQHMIRTIVGTLLKVGHGRMTPDEVDVVLAARDRRRSEAAVPACGLYLVEVRYGACQQ